MQTININTRKSTGLEHEKTGKKHIKKNVFLKLFSSALFVFVSIDLIAGWLKKRPEKTSMAKAATWSGMKLFQTKGPRL